MLESSRRRRHSGFLPVHDEPFSILKSGSVHSGTGPYCEFLDARIGDLDRVLRASHFPPRKRVAKRLPPLLDHSGGKPIQDEVRENSESNPEIELPFR